MGTTAAWILPLVCLGAPDALAVRMNPGPAPHLERVSFDLVGLDSRQLASFRTAAPGAASARPSLSFRVLWEEPPLGSGPPERVVRGTYRVVGSVVRFTPFEPIGPPPRRYRVLVERPTEHGVAARRIEAWFTPPPPGDSPR